LRDQALLLGGKSWSRAGGGVVPERLRTVLAGTGEPTADRLFSGPESRSDVALIPALLLQFQRPQPPPLMPVLRHEVRTLHTQFYRPQNLTNSARLSVSSREVSGSPCRGVRSSWPAPQKVVQVV